MGEIVKKEETPHLHSRQPLALRTSYSPDNNSFLDKTIVKYDPRPIAVGPTTWPLGPTIQSFWTELDWNVIQNIPQEESVEEIDEPIEPKDELIEEPEEEYMPSNTSDYFTSLQKAIQTEDKKEVEFLIERMPLESMDFGNRLFGYQGVKLSMLSDDFLKWCVEQKMIRKIPYTHKIEDYEKCIRCGLKLEPMHFSRCVHYMYGDEQMALLEWLHTHHCPYDEHLFDNSELNPWLQTHGYTK